MADPITLPEATAVTNSTPNPPDSITQPNQLDPSPSVSANLNQNPNPTAPPPPAILTPPPPPIQQYFRPIAPQFTPLAYQTPPPGVIMAPAPTLGNGSQPQVPGVPPSYAIAGQPVRYAQPMPNGYPAIPQGAMPPPVFSKLITLGKVGRHH